MQWLSQDSRTVDVISTASALSESPQKCPSGIAREIERIPESSTLRRSKISVPSSHHHHHMSPQSLPQQQQQSVGQSQSTFRPRSNTTGTQSPLGKGSYSNTSTFKSSHSRVSFGSSPPPTSIQEGTLPSSSLQTSTPLLSSPKNSSLTGKQEKSHNLADLPF